MTRTITIDPVTRIEGHSKITLHLDEQGSVTDAKFHVTQFRGFEKFCEGRPLTEMPSLMARICGICPVSHLMASAKACDDLLAVEIPRAANQLRRLMHMAQSVQSHALSFFHLSSPDLLMGMDSDPAKRNIYGLIQADPDRARDGVMLRKFGQQVIQLLGGKRIHPAWIVPGGVLTPLSTEVRDQILQGLPKAREIAQRTLDWFKAGLDAYKDEVEHFGNFPSLFMGTVGPEGQLDLYDGMLRFVDSQGRVVADWIKPQDYQQYIDEAVEDWSYLKFPYYKPMGYPKGIYRVGPLARLNVVDKCGTPQADVELVQFRQRQKGAVLSSFHFHYARLIEIVFSLEQMEQILASPEVLDKFVRARARPNRWEGVGVAEAPRGTLIHHYKIDRNGLMLSANLIIATGHNNLAIGKGILQVAQHYVDGKHIKEGMLNRCEALVRCYDPCLSCSTHALGQMPLRVELIDAQGQMVDQVQR